MNHYSVHSDQRNNVLVVVVEDRVRVQTLQRMQMERLNGGDGIESTLTTHADEWHKQCRLKFNIKAFDEQSRKELTSGQQRNTPTMHTQSADRLSGSTEPICFFCN